MNRIEHLIILSSLIIKSFSADCQISTTGIVGSINGYIVNLGGRIYFQPCDDSTKSLWESLDGRSFSLWYFREDLYLEAIENVGDSLEVRFTIDGEEKPYSTTLKYFYCKLEINMMFLDTSSFEVFSKCKITILYGNNHLPLEGFRVDNRVRKIIPKDFKFLKSIYDYYFQKGYVVPQWLDECYRKRLSRIN